MRKRHENCETHGRTFVAFQPASCHGTCVPASHALHLTLTHALPTPILHEVQHFVNHVRPEVNRTYPYSFRANFPLTPRRSTPKPFSPMQTKMNKMEGQLGTKHCACFGANCGIFVLCKSVKVARLPSLDGSCGEWQSQPAASRAVRSLCLFLSLLFALSLSIPPFLSLSICSLVADLLSPPHIFSLAFSLVAPSLSPPFPPSPLSLLFPFRSLVSLAVSALCRTSLASCFVFGVQKSDFGDSMCDFSSYRWNDVAVPWSRRDRERIARNSAHLQPMTRRTMASFAHICQ